MQEHNMAKRLEELKSMPFETLTDDQKKELNMLESLKKEYDNNQKMIPNFNTRPLYYDREGKSMSNWEWCGYCCDFEYKIIKQTTYGDFFVSTVWLGLDHDFLKKGPPIIFETMIFINNDREHELDGYMDRYSTEVSAILGHKKACKLANKAADKDLNRKYQFNKQQIDAFEKEKKDYPL